MASSNTRDVFTQSGYVLFRDYFSPSTAQTLRGYAREIRESSQKMLDLARRAGVEPSQLPGLIVVPEKDDPGVVCRVEDILAHHKGLADITAALVTPAISELMGEPYVPFKDKFNFKRPRGGAFPPHQDFAAYQVFGPRFEVTAMYTIDPATLENGCLHFASNYAELATNKDLVAKMVDGRALFHYHDGGPKNGDIREDVQEQIEWQAITTTPRDLVIFDAFVPHFSHPNGSPAPRGAMFMTHNALREGSWKDAYYHMKRKDPHNKAFHVSTPTAHAASGKK